jgi:protein-S-isoprenylcysteine O-methyltransferase Ste14
LGTTEKPKKNIWDRFAIGLWHLTTGERKRRITWTPIAAIIFFGILTGFVFLAFWLDEITGLPRFNALWSLIVAVILFVFGLCIVGWTLSQFFKNRGTPVPVSPPQKLITGGLYSYVRNPMALGAFLILEGIGFLFGSIFLVVLFAPLPVILYGLFIKAIEEKELEMRFGDEYRQYKNRVPMFFPRLKK